MGRPKSKEVEAVEKAIEKMHETEELTAETKPRDVAAKLPSALAKKMENRISPILKEAKRRHKLMESEDRAADWRKEMKKLSDKVKELGGPTKVEALIAESEQLDQRQREIEKQLRMLGGLSGAKQVLADLAAVADLFTPAD